MYNELQTIIGQAWENRELLAEASVQEAIAKMRAEGKYPEHLFF